MKKITILGCGMVGSVIARDLSASYQVNACDFSQYNLDRITDPAIKKIRADLLSMKRSNITVADMSRLLGVSRSLINNRLKSAVVTKSS